MNEKNEPQDLANELEKARENRHYDSTILDTLSIKTDLSSDEGKLSLIYQEVNSNYRHLADTRFKLLGLVPLASIFAWMEILTSLTGKNLPKGLAGTVVSIIGFFIIYGIRIYDKRNDELYNDLISRGRKIEEELGIDTAIFKGRPTSFRKAKLDLKINHSTGTNLIYRGVLIGWIILFFYYFFMMFN
ncbi:MAG: hypothetical protein AAFR87_02880 [Bacteroidota bacterium]